MKIRKDNSPAINFKLLTLFNLQNIHRTGLSTDTAGNTFACGRLCGHHNLHRTYFSTLAAACTQLLVDHVYTLCILCDSAILTCTRTFSALDTGIYLDCTIFLNDLDTGFSRIIYFVE